MCSIGNQSKTTLKWNVTQVIVRVTKLTSSGLRDADGWSRVLEKSHLIPKFLRCVQTLKFSKIRKKIPKYYVLSVLLSIALGSIYDTACLSENFA